MSASMSKSPLALSSSMKIEEETKFTQKQGIVTILSSDSERTRAGAAASLRRTLSADMSSKKWLSQNGLCPMKKIASSNELSLPIITDESSSSSSEEEEEDYLERRGQFDVWSSIQQDKNEKKKEEEERPRQFDIWSSIISQKENDDASKSLPQPYVHPLVKRSQNSLSEKSLQICTESLGSETGSDGFSSYSPSETEDVEEDKEEEEAEQQQTERVTLYDAEEEFSVAKYNSAASASCKKFLPRSFPPPIPSLSRQDGASVHMRPHRDNGRLVLEAVSVPSKNNFLAQRQDGRLVLTFVNDPLGSEGELKKEYEEEIHNKAEENNMEEFEEEFCEFEEDDNEEKEYEEEEEDDEIETRDIEIVMEQEPKLSNGVTNFHRLALMMNKPIGFSNRNPSLAPEVR
ncbi:protein FAF-like, chloroplastic [Quillaja saponaria]|uniref:Protein FAF-like, chloroplastic n=1 Tax=Quillaja saponaria TaxID=32244 RepID=A0AAD7KYM8_QUISA|nr:protein FAF-like, chloroplastic [Quillaja saponaria]